MPDYAEEADSSQIAEVMDMDAQLQFETNSQSSMGLLKCDNVVILYDNQISIYTHQPL